MHFHFYHPSGFLELPYSQILLMSKATDTDSLISISSMCAISPFSNIAERVLSSRVTNVIMYYGLMLGFAAMSGNLFLNFFLLSAVELPSNVLALYVCNRFGRRPTQLVFFCLSGTSMLLVIPLKFGEKTGGCLVTFGADVTNNVLERSLSS